jgi:hypothetical protein
VVGPSGDNRGAGPFGSSYNTAVLVDVLSSSVASVFLVPFFALRKHVGKAVIYKWWDARICKGRNNVRIFTFRLEEPQILQSFRP